MTFEPGQNVLVIQLRREVAENLFYIYCLLDNLDSNFK